MKILKWSLLAPILPRLILVVFNVSQPLLIRRVIDFLNEPENDDTRNVGYGLIGAYVLVYAGLAVCFPPHLHVYHTLNLPVFHRLVLLFCLALCRDGQRMSRLSNLQEDPDYEYLGSQ